MVDQPKKPISMAIPVCSQSANDWDKPYGDLERSCKNKKYAVARLLPKRFFTPRIQPVPKFVTGRGKKVIKMMSPHTNKNFLQQTRHNKFFEQKLKNPKIRENFFGGSRFVTNHEKRLKFHVFLNFVIDGHAARKINFF